MVKTRARRDEPAPEPGQLVMRGILGDAGLDVGDLRQAAMLNAELYGFYGVSVWVADTASPRERLEATKLVKYGRYAEFTVAGLTARGLRYRGVTSRRGLGAGHLARLAPAGPPSPPARQEDKRTATHARRGATRPARAPPRAPAGLPPSDSSTPPDNDNPENPAQFSRLLAVARAVSTRLTTSARAAYIVCAAKCLEKGRDRMKRLMLLVLGLAAALVFVPSAAGAGSAAHTYMLEMDAPNLGAAANGDMVMITGHPDFSVHPNAAEESGTSTHTASNGTVRGSGTWTATGLLDYQSYGCGVVLGTPIPPNFCGGKVKLRVTLTTPAGQLPATMTVICIIGPNPPATAVGDKRSEGAMLVVPGVINFNHTAGGDNVIIQTG